MNWQKQGDKNSQKPINQSFQGQSNHKTRADRGDRSYVRQQPSPYPGVERNTRLFPINSSSTKNRTTLPETNETASSHNNGLNNSEDTEQPIKPISSQPKSRRHHPASSSTPHKHRRPQRRKKKSPSPLKPLFAPFLFVFRLLIIFIGLSALLGTTLSIVNSTNTPATAETSQAVTAEAEQSFASLFSAVSLGAELSSLKSEINTLAASYSQLKPGIFLVDLDKNSYLTIQGEAPISSASTIKLPILVALFQDIDRGKTSLDEKLVMSKDLIAGGSGNMQYEKPGKQFSVLETAVKMIVISDNTATNMLIKKLGGAEALNQRFLEWGLAATVINNPLPDLEGTNTTSPADLGNLLIAIEKGNLVSLRSRDRIIQIMRDTRTNTLLPEGLEKEAIIAHKTGDIRSVLGDVGMVDMPNGKRYVISVLIQRPDNDPQAKELIQQISRTAYQHLK